MAAVALWGISLVACSGEPSAEPDTADAGRSAVDAGVPLVTIDFPGTVITGKVVAHGGAPVEACDELGRALYSVREVGVPTAGTVRVRCDGSFAVFASPGFTALRIAHDTPSIWAPLQLPFSTVSVDVPLSPHERAETERNIGDVALPPRFRVSGTVTGRPTVPSRLANERCGIIWLSTKSDAQPFAISATPIDCSGRFVADLPPGHYTLTWGKALDLPIVVSDRDVEMTLAPREPLALFSGTVSTEGGEPPPCSDLRAASMSVQLVATPGTWSDATLPVCKGVFHGFVPRGRYESVLVAISGAMQPSDGASVRVEEGLDLGDSVERSFRVRPHRLRGHVLDVAGGRVDGPFSQLLLWSAAGEHANVAPDDRGAFDALALTTPDQWAVYTDERTPIGHVSAPESGHTLVRTILIPTEIALTAAPQTSVACASTSVSIPAPLLSARFDEGCRARTWLVEGSRASMQIHGGGVRQTIELVPLAPRAELTTIVAGTPTGAAPMPPVELFDVRFAAPTLAKRQLRELFPPGSRYILSVGSAETDAFAALPMLPIETSAELTGRLPREGLSARLIVHAPVSQGLMPDSFLFVMPLTSP